MSACQFDMNHMALLLIIVLIAFKSTNATFTQSEDMLTVKLHNKTGLAMFQLSVNGRIVIARRNPTPSGKVYKIPLAKYGQIHNISVVVHGDQLTVDSITFNGTNISKGFIYTGTDLSPVMTTTVPKGSHVNSEQWTEPGVYVFIP